MGRSNSSLSADYYPGGYSWELPEHTASVAGFALDNTKSLSVDSVNSLRTMLGGIASPAIPKGVPGSTRAILQRAGTSPLVLGCRLIQRLWLQHSNATTRRTIVIRLGRMHQETTKFMQSIASVGSRPLHTASGMAAGYRRRRSGNTLLLGETKIAYIPGDTKHQIGAMETSPIPRIRLCWPLAVNPPEPVIGGTWTSAAT